MSSVVTMETWEVEIECYEKLPDTFKESLEEFSEDNFIFPFTVYLPKNSSKISNKRQAKLISILNEELHIYEKYEDRLEETCFKLWDIDYIEKGNVLLYSWITINGVSKGNKLSFKIDYNTVNDKIFNKLLNLLRFGEKTIARSSDEAELSKLNYLEALDYKYFASSKTNLLANSSVVCSVYQHEICKKVARAINWRISPTHNTMLTDKELIIISEEYHKIKKKSDYGTICKYIPVGNVSNIELEPHNEKDICICTINIRDNYFIKLLFEPLKKENIEFLKQKIIG